MAKKAKKLLPEAKPEKTEEEKVKKTKIRVIGIGGGGGNIVSELAQRVERPTFLAANTDSKALKEVSRKVERFSFGKNLTHGLGTGMNPELGETAAQNEKERIKKLLQGQDLVILIGSLGGGVGSGASPVFAQISKNLGNLTYGIFTLPFKFEGEKKMEIAKNSLEKIRPKLNALTIIPNERIFQTTDPHTKQSYGVGVDKDTPLNQALSTINKSLAESLEGLIETIYEPGLINIDFADLKTVFEGWGRMCYLNTTSFFQKEGRVKETIEKALNSPLYPYSIRGAKAVLYNIAGPKGICLEEVKEISNAISEKINKEAKIIFGISENKKYGDNIKITVLATGISTKNFLTKPRLIKKPIKPSRISATKAREGKPAQILQSKTREGKKTPPIEKQEVKVKIKKPEKEKAETKKPVTKKPKIKKIKTKAMKKPVPETKLQTESEAPKEPLREPAEQTKKEKPSILRIVKIRKNALQLKKETEEAEKEMLEKERFWETPAFLRKKLIKNQ